MDNVSRATTRVFVTNYQERDFSPAEQYGEPIYITRAFVPLKDIGKLRDKLAAHIKYSQPSDYVILTGPSVLIAMFTAMWIQKHGMINILSWNKKDKLYREFVVGLDSVSGND